MVERIRGRKGIAVRTRIKAAEPLCRMCLAKGRVTAGQEVDHIVPLSRGGTNAPENMQVLCVECHIEKTTGRRRVRIGIDGWPIE